MFFSFLWIKTFFYVFCNKQKKREKKNVTSSLDPLSPEGAVVSSATAPRIIQSNPNTKQGGHVYRVVSDAGGGWTHNLPAQGEQTTEIHLQTRQT